MTYFIAFLARVIVTLLWQAFRRQTPTPPPPPEPTSPSEKELEAEILRYLTTHHVYHINDLCQAIAHPKGARHIRGQFHRLMEEGKIQYRDMIYTAV